ncbi:MAG: ABC transporter permease [Deltaproteobacteria bacterium]|jgi:NitT/TauT family transport system permease protein|nr:ABC transporter permease [Deltaproteobacteria bacterium]
MPLLTQALKKSLTNYFYKFGSIVLFVLLWQLACLSGLAPETFVASPVTILETLWKYILDGSFFKHTSISLLRAFYGFLLATVVAIPLGFMLGGWFKKFSTIIGPLLTFLGQFNPFALFAIFLLLFGIGEVSKVAMIFWVAIWPLLYNASLGVKSVDPALIKLARSMGLGRTKLLFYIVLPSSATYLFNGLRLAAATAFFMLIPAEMMGASRGLGWLIINAQVNYQIPKLYTGTVVIVVFGLLIDWLFRLLERRLITWKEPQNLHA